jgi:hypothetical protein
MGILNIMVTGGDYLADADKLEMASRLDALTTPDKHDILVVKDGRGVKVKEIAENPAANRRVEWIMGESTLHKFETFVRQLPENHPLGYIQLVVGPDLGCPDFFSFLAKWSKRKGFNLVRMIGTRTSKEIFDDFLKTPMDETKGDA